MQEFLVHIAEDGVSIVDYLPYVISILSILSTLVITIIQFSHNYKLHKKNTSFDIKKEAILEALDFLDTYISWLDMDSEVAPVREHTNTTQLTIKSRKIYNKLCITCNNKKVIESFMNMICPDLKDEEKFYVFKKYDEFRNECRKELGIDTIKLPKEKGYVNYVNTRALNEYSKNLEKNGCEGN